MSDDNRPVERTLATGTSVLDAIRNSKASDYDGHTEFWRMTPYERLQWLDAAVTFMEKLKPGN